MGHALLKKAILLLKMANLPFDLLIAVAAVLGMAGTYGIDLARLTGVCKDPIQNSNQFVPSRSILLSNTL